MADARAAWDLGIPDTAVLVIGALTLPSPTPKIPYATTRYISDVPGASWVKSSAPIAIAAPDTTRASRARPAPTRRPDSGEHTVSARAIGSVARPAVDARMPRDS